MQLSFFNRSTFFYDNSFKLCLQGNQDNRVVIFDNKIIDYINFILRAAEFQSCPTEKVR